MVGHQHKKMLRALYSSRAGLTPTNTDPTYATRRCKLKPLGMSTPYHDAAASSSSSSQAMNSQQQSQPEFQPGQYAYPLVAGQAPQIQHQSSNAQQALPQSRLTAEQARKDRTLAEFLLMLDDYEPLVSEMLQLNKMDDARMAPTLDGNQRELTIVYIRYRMK